MEGAGTKGPAALHLLRLRPPFRFGAWVSAEAATLFTAFGVLGLESSFEAFEATDFDVLSFLAIL